MKIGWFLTRLLRRPVQACAAVTAAMAVLSLLSWAFVDWRAMTFGPDFVPMAPSTAWSLLLLSCGLLLHNHWPSKAPARAMAYFSAIGVALVGLTVWAQWVGGLELPIEGWLTNTTDRVGNVPVGRMSPLTATAFLLATLALLFELPPLGHHWWCRQFSSALSMAVSLISFAVVLSYAAGMPLLYGMHTIPMALWTAISFVPLTLGLLAASGADTLPLSLLQTWPEVGSEPSQARVVVVPMLAFVLLSAGIGTVGYCYFRYQVAASSRAAEYSLSAIADLKVRQILKWRQERLGDGREIMAESRSRQDMQAFFADPSRGQSRAELLEWFEGIRKHNEGLRIVLLDRRMKVQMSLPKHQAFLGPIAEDVGPASPANERRGDVRFASQPVHRRNPPRSGDSCQSPQGADELRRL